MMRLLLCFLFVVTNMGSLRRETQAATTHLRLKINNIDHSGRIAIELDNQSSSSIRIWKDSNSWGAARWRVLVLNNKGNLQGFYQNPHRAFTRNIPGFTEIASGAHIAKKIDLTDGDWCTLDQCPSREQRGTSVREVSFEPGDIVIAVYDVPVSGEARDMSVWYGVTAVSAIVQ